MGQIGQQSFFDLESTDTTRYLHIIKDGQVVDLGLSEIFPTEVYDELVAVSYVSSARFFSKVVKGFVSVQFVLGIPDAEFLNNFARNIQKFIDIRQRITFWNELEESIKEEIQQKRITLRFTTFGTPPISIHSKIYLLRNQKTDKYRVIIGSANFTQKAFASKNQFEELMIFDDNPELYQIYFERFKKIYANTSDYIPEECLRKKDLKQAVYADDPEVLKKVLLEELEKKRTTIFISKEVMEEIEAAPIEITYHQELADVTLQIVKSVTKSTKTGGYTLANNLRKKATAIKTFISRTSKHSFDNDGRVLLQYDRREKRLFVGNKENSELHPLSQLASPQEIQQSLMVINRFIEAYKEFAIHPKLANQARVFEAILYAFCSPFIWKMREDYVQQEGRESVRAIFRPFLIIAGRARSGKTTALEFISILLGHHGKRYFSYREIEKSGILLDYFESSNVYPILVDEIFTNFFTSKDQRKGEALIKHVSNAVKDTHPVLIATTNQTNFSINGQVLRRVYYIEINNVFDDSKTHESNRYLGDILASANNSLFKDFTARMSELIADGEKFYEVDDMLYTARQIFKTYYKEAYLDLPEWFSETTFMDYAPRLLGSERGRRLWQNTFKAYREAFTEQTEETLFVDTSQFCENSKNRKIYINYLGLGVVREDNVILVLGKNEFYEFIQYDEAVGTVFHEEQKEQVKPIAAIRSWLSDFFKK